MDAIAGASIQAHVASKPLTVVLACRYELGSEEDDMDAVRRKATALTPRFHVMLVRCWGQGKVMCNRPCCCLAGAVPGGGGWVVQIALCMC